MNGSKQPQRQDAYSSSALATDAEDERWVGEGGGSAPAAHGAGRERQDPDISDAADSIDADDSHKVEKLTTLGTDRDPDEGSD